MDTNVVVTKATETTIRLNLRIRLSYSCAQRNCWSLTDVRFAVPVHLENTATGQTSIEDSSGIFIFIGATPCTGFLGDAVLKDDKGFVVTGNELTASGKWPLPDRFPLPLETSSPGVFVAGDCRSRTTKRVAFAVGDGALAVTCVHDLLGTHL